MAKTPKIKGKARYCGAPVEKALRMTITTSDDRAESEGVSPQVLIVEHRIVAGAFGKARSVAFASDCWPHWAPPAFVEWDGYVALWSQMAAWAAGRS